MAKKKTRSRRKALAADPFVSHSMHVHDKQSKPQMAALEKERKTHAGFAFHAAADPTKLDPETMAKRFLSQALESTAVKGLNAPAVAGVESEFKSLGTETVPLMGTTVVKFRQMLNKIPVYGSLITVELDESNNLLGINSAVGQPSGVSPVAKISPADAIKAVDRHPGYDKSMAAVTPRLSYFHDSARSKWRLVYILEDVHVTPLKKHKRAPVLMDYVVDAHTGTVVAKLPRTPSMSPKTRGIHPRSRKKAPKKRAKRRADFTRTGVDGLGVTRTFRVFSTGRLDLLEDRSLNVKTYDFAFKDPAVQRKLLPGREIGAPPAFSPSAVSAHANGAKVSSFMRETLMRNNIDDKGGAMISSVNCVEKRFSRDGKSWLNAFWNGNQMVYGQRFIGSNPLSLAVALDVVGHEMFHGVTDKTSHLEYANQPGALNESYSDIFGIIIANFDNPDPRTWAWDIGAGLTANGKPFRSMSDPTLYGQPDHFRNFQVLPNNERGDWGGVHTNSGIHNKAAFNILTSVDSSGRLHFTPAQVAHLFYNALTQHLTTTSKFTDSLRAVKQSAMSYFRSSPAPTRLAKISAIEKGFSAVGIT